jgi:hypothetical protein
MYSTFKLIHVTYVTFILQLAAILMRPVELSVRSNRYHYHISETTDCEDCRQRGVRITSYYFQFLVS